MTVHVRKSRGEAVMLEIGTGGDAGPQSCSTSDPARRRRPVVTLHVGSGLEAPARILGNGEIPTPLRDLIMICPNTPPEPEGSWNRNVESPPPRPKRSEVAGSRRQRRLFGTSRRNYVSLGLAFSSAAWVRSLDGRSCSHLDCSHYDCRWLWFDGR